MLRLTSLYCVLSLVTVAALSVTTIETVSAAETEKVEYRLTSWKTMHFDDTKKGGDHFDAVKKLGCEVKKDNHGGHLDVSYRCKEWKAMNVASHNAAHDWEKWLKGAGFETKHAH